MWQILRNFLFALLFDFSLAYGAAWFFDTNNRVDFSEVIFALVIIWAVEVAFGLKHFLSWLLGFAVYGRNNVVEQVRVRYSNRQIPLPALEFGRSRRILLSSSERP